MATTKPISTNALNQGSATVGVQRGGASASIVKWDGSDSLRPAYQSNHVTQYDARDTSSRFDDYGLRRKTVEIGDWDMESSQTATVAHGLTNNLWKNVRNIEVVVRNDDDDTYYTDSTDTSANADDGVEIEKIDATNVTLKCAAATSTFANSSFNQTSYNRGWVTIWYE
tara:strand:+ start:2932 stop:3438 length:507 start_codon:yes stop_codon:yes gene_type:complete